MRRFINAIEYIQLRIAALFLLMFIIFVILQVTTRYVPGFSALWTEEAAKYSFIWSVMLGAAVMVRHKGHFSMGVIAEKLQGKWAILNQLFIHLLIASFGLIMAYYGYKLTKQFWNWNVSSLPSLSQRYVWVCLPISGFTMFLYSIENLIELFTERADRGDA
ncbi:MAG: hypothetical protein JM58_15610 [Peptococcaceae bacterium BICA1-8]|nr:MAG: hypothetical protein JM58_15610 [Peptococcaceae bacterium BICA1-8]